MENKKGKFMVLEGIDGCGKDTQQKMLENYSTENNIAFEYAQVFDERNEKQARLREAVFNKDFRFGTDAEIFIFWADKFEMLPRIKKALDAGVNVLANRWELSQYAYQIYGKQREDLRDITEKVGSFLEKDLCPDLYILFDITPEESARRKSARSETTGKFEDYYDTAKKDFFERAATGYKTEIQKYNHVIINGEQSKEKVFADTLKAIENILN